VVSHLQRQSRERAENTAGGGGVNAIDDPPHKRSALGRGTMRSMVEGAVLDEPEEPEFRMGPLTSAPAPPPPSGRSPSPRCGED